MRKLDIDDDVRALAGRGYCKADIIRMLRVSAGTVADRVNRLGLVVDVGWGRNPQTRRQLFQARWSGRVLLPRRMQRRRTIVSVARSKGLFVVESGVIDEAALLGPTMRSELENIIYRVGKVDDSSDDYRSEAA